MLKIKSRKLKSLFFSFSISIILILIIINSSITQVSCQETNTNSLISEDMLKVKALTFNKNSMGETGEFEFLNCKPYGLEVISFENLGGYKSGDNIIYQARVEFGFGLNVYTDAIVDKAFILKTTKLEGTYLTTKMYSSFLEWGNAKWGNYKYSFNNLNYTQNKPIDYDGDLCLDISFNNVLVKYNNSIISSVETKVDTIKAQRWQAGIIGEYKDYIYDDVYNPGFTVENSVTSKSIYDAVTGSSGDAIKQVQQFLNNAENFHAKPLDTKTITLQNYYKAPLTESESVSFTQKQTTTDISGVIATVDVSIRPEITRTYRQIEIRKAHLEVDTCSDPFGWGAYGIQWSFTKTYSPDTFIEQNMALHIQNHFVNQKYSVVTHITGAVPISVLDRENYDLNDPTLLQGDWYWDASGVISGGKINLDITGNLLLSILFNIGIVIVVIAIGVILYKKYAKQRRR